MDVTKKLLTDNALQICIIIETMGDNLLSLSIP